MNNVFFYFHRHNSKRRKENINCFLKILNNNKKNNQQNQKTIKTKLQRQMMCLMKYPVEISLEDYVCRLEPPSDGWGRGGKFLLTLYQKHNGIFNILMGYCLSKHFCINTIIKPFSFSPRMLFHYLPPFHISPPVSISNRQYCACLCVFVYVDGYKK